MEIKVKAILRSPDLTADIGDIINVDEKTGNLLINAGAAELVAEETKAALNESVTAIDGVVYKDLKVELPEIEEKPKQRKVKGALQ